MKCVKHIWGQIPSPHCTEVTCQEFDHKQGAGLSQTLMKWFITKTRQYELLLLLLFGFMARHHQWSATAHKEHWGCSGLERCQLYQQQYSKARNRWQINQIHLSGNQCNHTALWSTADVLNLQLFLFLCARCKQKKRWNREGEKTKV